MLLPLHQIIEYLVLPRSLECRFVPHRQYDTSKLGAPVAEMILPDDMVAAERQHARHRIADDRAADVPDVHFLGNIRRRIIDNDACWLRVAVDPEPRVSGNRVKLLRQPRARKPDVNEPRPGNGGLFLNHLAQIKPGDDLFGDSRGLLFCPERSERALERPIAALDW